MLLHRDTQEIKLGAKSKGGYDLRLIFKCTRRCNLECEYCVDRLQSPERNFNVELIATIFNEIAEDPVIKSFQFIWHGGEPLLLGVEFFKKIIFLQKKFFEGKIKFTNLLQTNATLISEIWVEFFKIYNFHIGVSLDGPSQIHNKQRPIKGGMDSFNRCLRGIRHLKERGLHFGVLTVVTNNIMNFGAQQLLNFYKAHGINNFGLLSLHDLPNDYGQRIKYNRSYSDFMVSMLKLWLEEDDIKLTVREFDSKLDLFFGLPHRLCKDGGLCVGKYFGVEADGTVWHCDKFLNQNNFLLGNIFNCSFADIKTSEKLFKLAKQEIAIRMQCAGCDWFHLCKGGCLADLIEFNEAGGQIGTDDCLQFRIYDTFSNFLGSSPVIIKAALEELSISSQN
jgi:uncharacterized protein